MWYPEDFRFTVKISVISGCERHSIKTPSPTMPVVPVIITFISFFYFQYYFRDVWNPNLFQCFIYCESLTFSIQSTTFPFSCSCVAMWVIAIVGEAPCQCFSLGANHTTSPGRISSTGPPSFCAHPTPETTIWFHDHQLYPEPFPIQTDYSRLAILQVFVQTSNLLYLGIR